MGKIEKRTRQRREAVNGWQLSPNLYFYTDGHGIQPDTVPVNYYHHTK